MPRLRFANRLKTLISRFRRDRKANIAVIAALTMVPVIFLLGMTLELRR
jgi:Flp pilus assembly protein TadG